MKQMHRRLVTAFLGLGLMVGAQADAPPAAEDSDYAACRYRIALMQFERRAADGNAEAAEMAGQMYFFGEGLYGKQVARDLERARHWLALAAHSGRPVAGYLLARIDANTVSARAAETCTDAYVFGREDC